MKLYYISGDQVRTVSIAKEELSEYEDGSYCVDVKNITYTAWATRKEAILHQIDELSDEISELHEEISRIEQEQEYWEKQL